MLSKNKIKYIHSLELKKTRKEEQVFLAEGPKLTGDLLGRFPCRFLAATSSWLQAHPDIQSFSLTIGSTPLASIVSMQLRWLRYCRRVERLSLVVSTCPQTMPYSLKRS